MARRTRIQSAPSNVEDPIVADYLIQIADAINLIKAPDPSYGGMFEEEDTPELAIGTTPVIFNRFSSLLTGTEDISTNTVSGIITVGSWGTYDIAFSSSFTGSANIELNMYVYQSGTKTNIGSHRGTTAQTAGNMGIAPTMLSITSGDTLAVYVNADGDGKVITNIDGQFTIRRID